jgi:hypothetical protein
MPRTIAFALSTVWRASSPSGSAAHTCLARATAPG